MSPRVLILFGSEGGNSKSCANKLSRNLKARGGGNFTIENVAPGNSVANVASFVDLAKNYDVLLIATSSYGEGDPPFNINLFVLSLLRASKAKTKPLNGMQHALIGWGESVYDTFQNTPRLTDKLLGECGSRRMLQRTELDCSQDYDESEILSKQVKKFEDDVLALLCNLPPATAPPACSWTVPKSQLLEKSEAELGGGESGSSGSQGIAVPWVPVVAIFVAVVGVVGAYAHGMLDGAIFAPPAPPPPKPKLFGIF